VEETAAAVSVGNGRAVATVAVSGAAAQVDAPACHVCGTIMTRSGSCYRCGNCGTTSGCS